MNRKIGLLAVGVVGSLLTGAANAELVGTVGGQTSVALDFGLLSSAAGLDFSGVSPGVISPGNLPDSVAFSITSPSSSSQPTTFNYDTDDFFGTFNGTIEHRGAVYFNDDAVQIGNFSIGFRESTGSFYVASTYAIEAILFDIGITSATPAADTFTATGDLLVSNEFAQFLLDAGLASSDLTGADVGDALIEGLNQAIPAPAGLAVLGIGGLVARRRRN